MTVALLVAVSASAAAGEQHPQDSNRSALRTVTGAYTWRADLDPQVAWANYGLNVVYDTYIPLLTYRHAGGRAGSEVIPGLARSLPRITSRGRTYTLYLRKGLRYSNGRPVKASDFEFAVSRMSRIESNVFYSGPGHFYNDIVGFANPEKTPHRDVRGIVTDNRTGRIVIHLVRPERSFSRKLAMTWAAPVPPSTPAHNRTFHPPPATGPYVITDSTRRGWTYKRNPEWWSRNGRLMPQIPGGHLDTIRVKVVKDVAKAVRQVERGKLDWISEEFSGPGYVSLRRRLPSRLRLEPTLGTEYFWLNTTEPPFDDVRVRRAINYAVDRTVFSRLSGGQMLPTQQIIPPDLPGYTRSTLYPHDLVKARRLVSEADPSVRDITVWTYGEPGHPTQVEYAVYFAKVMDELGFSAHVRVLDPGRYIGFIGNPRHRNLDSGVSGWSANYPDPDDFFRETLGSRPTPYFNENLSQFFSPGLQRVIDHLETRTGPTVPSGRYAALDRAFMRFAPWVPIGSYCVPLFVSKRIDIRKVVSNPSFGVDIASLRIRGSS